MHNKLTHKPKISILTLSMGHGGAEKVISVLLPELVKEYEVYLFLFYNKIHYEIPKEVKVVSVYKNAKNNLFRRTLSPYFVYKKYKSFLKNENINISISLLLRPNVVNGLIKTKKSNVRVVMSERNYPSILYNTSSIRMSISKCFINRLYNKADIIFSNSNYINKDLRDNFLVKIPLHTIYNPILEPSEKLKGEHFDGIALTKIVSVGRFDEVKNHMMLFKGVENIENASLTVIGDGRLRENYKQYLQEKQLTKKIILPGVSKNVLTHLMKYHIFVLTSNSEGFPNALLEAMSIGLPVISTNCLSGPLELLNEGEEISIEKGNFYKGKYGLLVNVNDVKGLEKAILFYQKDENQLKYYSSQSLLRARDFYIENIYKHFKQLILE